jgi:predicted nuclease of predicted toxin-antitoxin system
LREAGFDAIHVGESGLSTAEDAEILRKGREEGFVIVTLDADFHALLVLSGASLPSVIRISIEGLQGRKAANLIGTVLDHCGQELTRGALVTVQQDRIRIRRLPLID